MMTEQSKKNPKYRYFSEGYISRINRVMDYIEENIDEHFSLERLAHVANFSPFYFHRIFKAMVGETLNDFIKRIRIEKSASKLIYNPKKSITDIAYDCGFSSSAAFARSFREAFHMTPSQWRSNRSGLDGKIRQIKNNINQSHNNKGKDFDISFYYIDVNNQNLKWRIKMKDKKQVHVEVKEMPELNVAYVRYIGPYKGDSKLFEGLFNKLMTWAGPRGLIQFPDTLLLTVYHDDPKVTDESKLRTSICMTIPKNTPVEGEVGQMQVPGGKFAVARFELAEDEYEEAWNNVFGKWLPESGYQPDDRLCYEFYHNNPKEHPENKCIVDICIPVKPL